MDSAKTICAGMRRNSRVHGIGAMVASDKIRIMLDPMFPVYIRGYRGSCPWVAFGHHLCTAPLWRD